MQGGFSFDYIIAGGGASGLSLVWQMAHSSLRNKKILIIDAEEKNTNDRTWCFWSKSSPEFKSARKVSWQNIAIHSEKNTFVQRIAPYRYYYLPGADFYREVKEELNNVTTISFLRANISGICSTDSCASVETDLGTFTAQYVFNSLPKPVQLKPEQHFFIKQHFCGWKIKTKNPVFVPDTVHWMDFRTSQQKGVCFFYVLPFSGNQALIEYTAFAGSVFTEEEYKLGIEHYLYYNHGLARTDYTIEETEQGVIPMTNYPFEMRDGERIRNIGTRGGMTKPTTGYTFSNIQEDSKKITALLEAGKPPFYKRNIPGRFAFYDNLLLHIITHRHQVVKPIMLNLFRFNQFTNILVFLSERTNILQDARIFITLPWPPFLKALYLYYIKPHVFNRKKLQQKRSSDVKKAEA
jgi:lycopene beta-cyclase